MENKFKEKQFDFMEWKRAFEYFYANEDKGACLIISSNYYTSGYWVQQGNKNHNLKEDRVYEGGEVRLLEERVKQRVQMQEAGMPFKSGVIF